MILVLLGPPGVGKGTQGAFLARAEGWTRLGTGDLLREARREGTELGQEAQGYMDRGELVPDELILELVREKLGELEPETHVIFDGFPRTLAQAEALDRLLPEEGREVDAVVVLDAPEDVLVKRISGRRSCPECGGLYNVYYDPPATDERCNDCGARLFQREDDRPETVRARLEVYREETEPLIRHYEAHPARVLRIAGDRPLDEVRGGVREALRDELGVEV